jgi:hypothetical protein
MPKKTCDICGANMNADCHAHAQWCPYSCEYKKPEQPPIGNLPIGNGVSILLLLSIIYTIIKLKIKN